MSAEPAYPPRPPDESPAVERRRLIRERDEARAYAKSLAEDLDDAAGHIEAWKHSAEVIADQRDGLRRELTAEVIASRKLQAERDEARADLQAARTNHAAILRDVQESEQEQRDEARRLRAELVKAQDENTTLARQLADVLGIATDPVHGATVARQAIRDYLTPKEPQ